MIDALIIGGDGQIGKALLAGFQLAKLDVVATTRRWPPYGRDLNESYLPFDLRYPTYLPKAKVTYLCTGINGFRQCEDDPVEAKRINTTLLCATAYRALDMGSNVVYLSSCAVETHPKTTYAFTKYEVENRLGPKGAACVRVGPVAIPGRKVYPNQHYNPISVPDLINLLMSFYHRFRPGLYKVTKEGWTE
jgi:dTDP-4-dehydrorhamnose reductase